MQGLAFLSWHLEKMAASVNNGQLMMASRRDCYDVCQLQLNERPGWGGQVGGGGGWLEGEDLRSQACKGYSQGISH